MTDRNVVLAVVLFLGALSIVGMGGAIWLIDHGVDGERVAIISGPLGAVIGALSTLLASTRTSPPGSEVTTTTTTTQGDTTP